MILNNRKIMEIKFQEWINCEKNQRIKKRECILLNSPISPVSFFPGLKNLNFLSVLKKFNYVFKDILLKGTVSQEIYL